MYWYKRVLRRVVPESSDAAKNIGLLYREQGRLNKALEWLQRALSSGCHDAALPLAKIHLQQRRVEEAVKYLKSLVGSDYVSEATDEEARSLLRDLIGIES